MPRNRTIYQCEAVYVGPTPATGGHFYAGSPSSYAGVGGTNTGNNLIKQLYRIQNANYDFNVAHRDVNQFGELAAIDRLILDQPTVSLNFEYIVNSFANEAAMGLTISSGQLVSCISGILNKTQDEKNYFIKTQSEGNDAVGNATDAPYYVIGLGNGFISNYSVQCAVGDFPRANVSIEALNMNFDVVNFAPGTQTSGTNTIPAVNPTDGTQITAFTYDLPKTQSSTGLGYSALRPGDVLFSLGWNEGGVKISDAKIQNFNLGFDLSRTPLQKLGSKYAFAKEINFPANSTLSITADVGDLTTGKLSEIVNNDNAYDLTIQIKQPGSNNIATSYTLKAAKLDSQSFSSSLTANKSVTLQFTSQIGAAGQTTKGIFFSGII